MILFVPVQPLVVDELHFPYLYNKCNRVCLEFNVLHHVFIFVLFPHSVLLFVETLPCITIIATKKHFFFCS